MRIKKDYMRNDQLLPAYNVQFGVADEYIAVADVNHYRSDMDCFVPLIEQFHKLYGFYRNTPLPMQAMVHTTTTFIVSKKAWRNI